MAEMESPEKMVFVPARTNNEMQRRNENENDDCGRSRVYLKVQQYTARAHLRSSARV